MRPTLARIVTRVTVIQVGLAVGAALVAGALFLAYRGGVDGADRAGRAALVLEQLRGEVLSGETGVRGYALTGATSFLEPYRQSLAAVDRGFQRAAPQLTDGERPWLARASTEVQRWRVEFAEPILRLVRAGRLEAAAAFARRGVGKERIDAFRSHLDRVEAAVGERVDDEQDDRDLVAVVGLIVIGVLGIALVVATLLLRRRLHRSVIEPMQALVGATAALGEGGDFGVRTQPHGVRETAVAIDAFNRMAGRMEETVTELRELDELKSRFVGSVSHELRTPLTSIAGYVDELREEELGPLNEEQGEALEVVARNADNLTLLIDDLLLLASIEARGLELDHDPVPVADLVEELAAELRPVATSKSVELRVEVAPTGCVVSGDRKRLRQGVANLIANAVKFSPPGAPVDLRVRADGDRVVAEVEDRGPGIPADELPRIAERFFRASTAEQVAGTGLGLAITREIVERHGGRLEVLSTVGRGSTFRINLPAG